MAKWEIRRFGTGPGQLNLSFINLNTNEYFDCGSMDGQVPDAWVLQWLFDHFERLSPGDLIRLSSGKTLYYSRIRGRS